MEYVPPERSASTNTKDRSSVSAPRATGRAESFTTTAGSNFCSVRGPGWVDVYDLTAHHLVSSFTVHGLFTTATETAGVSGAPQGRVV
jgi:hypothetical protein